MSCEVDLNDRDARDLLNLQVTKQKMVNRNETRGGHNGAPITLVEQESQKCENTKVTFNHALALLDVER